VGSHYIMKLLLAISLVLITPICHAEAIASMDNQSGGKIVLTNETCTRNGKVYSDLFRAYAYNGTGTNVEGCFFIEDETVLIAWLNPDNPNGAGTRSRYKLENFTLRQKPKGGMKYGT